MGYGISFGKNHKIHKKAYKDSELKRLVDLYKQGLSIQEIADDLGRSYISVRTKLAKQGFSIEGRTNVC